jgi:hypothetical protein
MSNGIGEKGKARIRSLINPQTLYEMNDKELLLLQKQLEDPRYVLELVRNVRLAVDTALHRGVRPPLKIKMVDVGRDPGRMSPSYRSSRSAHGKSNK